MSINNLSQSVRVAIQNKNWYVALAVALTLPDICGRLVDPNQGSARRYIAWFDAWLRDRYTRKIGPAKKDHVFLSGTDCYALRCSFLHQGEFDISGQRAQAVLDEFSFLVTPENWTIHLNQSDNKLQLQVDVFCLDICDAVDDWVKSVAGNSDIQDRINHMASIEGV